MSKINPPVAKCIEHTETTHGDVRQDPYFWLREKENEEVINYLKEENAYTESVMKHTEPLQQKIYEEFVSRIKETDLSVPVKRDNYYYYSRTEEGKNYSIYCRKEGSLDAAEEILLDGNKLAEGKKYFSLRSFKVNDNHQLLGYAVDFDGSEYYDIYIKDLSSGELKEQPIQKTGGGLVWANDNKTFFYTTLDDTHRPYRLHRHLLGTEASQDEIVFEEPDGAYFLGAYKTKSKAFLVIQLGSKVTNEAHFLDANNPTGKFSLFAKRQQNEEYSITHYGDHFYILTNDKALDFKLMKTPVGNTARSNWETYIAHEPNVMLTDVEAFKDHLVVHCRKNGLKNIQIINVNTQEKHDIEFPEKVYTYWEESNPDFNTNLLRFMYSSMISPRTVYNYNMDTKEFIKLKEYEVQGGYDKSEYAMEWLKAKAEDGTEVPISVVYKKGLERDGTNPCYLYGYGSYGYPMDPYFSSVRISLLDRGFVFAMGHIRGGSELGRQWYNDGKFLKKKNTFTDFIACGEHLISQGYTSKDKLCISGGSAGGLLVGASMNFRPDLFKAVIASVPFVDVINTMLDDTIPLTVVEYEEWGNPNDKVYYDYMKSYSPYDNVEAKDYPNLLITAGLNDPRVQYWEPAKWAAKLRATKTDRNTLLLKTNMGAGHGGASGRYEALKELAFEYSFILNCLNLR